VIAAAALATTAWLAHRLILESRAPASVPLPEVSRSPYLNTGPDARYVGHEACRKCHPDAHESYAGSAMSRSLADVDPLHEPEDASYEHWISGQRFDVYRRDGRLWQRYVLPGEKDEPDIVLADFPLKYVVGSGHFSKTYLAEIDGFLVEAPLTWYSATGKWGMSPGFDTAAHLGFQREASERCVSCHAGRVELIDRSERLTIYEHAIGCERCHGPGSLHVESRSSFRDEPQPAGGEGAIDYTIVNPVHLSRELAEAICEQCHLTSNAEVTVRGRSLSEFRPGLPLQDFLITYRLEDPQKSMKVVGHVEQLALSRCYRESKTLTCVICHDPHINPEPAGKLAHYQTVCLSCHTLADCRVDPAERDRQTAENDCLQCHMPSSRTEIVHLAFTHHRIGIHPRRPAREGSSADTADERAIEAALEPIHDISRLGEIDRLRSLGLAYYNRALHHGPHSLRCAERAQELLEQVRGQGLREGQVDSALMHLLSRTNDPRALVYAAGALDDKKAPASARMPALYFLALEHFQKGHIEEAAALLHELVQVRRGANDWALLGKCEVSRGNTAAAREAFEKAVSIDPKLVPTQIDLARLYAQEGRHELARKHREIARQLEKLIPPVDSH
jgi:predicted CXXCH cytochrome family protein